MKANSSSKIHIKYKINIFKHLIVFISISLLLTSIILSKETGESSQDTLLNMNLQELMNIEITTGTKIKRKLREATSKIVIINKETIKNRGYITLDDVLKDLPGFQFRDIIGFNSYFFQRGVPNQNNLILLLVDGIQINELNSCGFYGGAQYNLSNVKQIEVLYGPSSSLYGTNAISGIINIITNDPKDFNGVKASLTAGGFNTYIGALTASYYSDDSDLGALVSMRYYSSEKADLKLEKGDNNWTDKLENFEKDLAIDCKFNYKNLLVGANFQNKQASRSTNFKSVNTNYLDYGSNWNMYFLNIYSKYSHVFSDKFLFNSQIYYRNTTLADNSISYTLDTAQVGQYRPNDQVGAELILQFVPIEELNITGGFLFEYEELAKGFSTTMSTSKDDKPPIPPRPDLEHNRLFSSYIQLQYEFLNYFNIIGGARIDHSSYYDDVITPRTGLIFSYGNFNTKLLYNEAFRAPKPWDYLYGKGNNELKPETIKSFEIDIDYLIIKELSINLSYYNNQYSNLIVTNSVVNMTVNEDIIKTNGLELSANLLWNDLNLYFNYTYNESTDEFGNEIPEIAKHSLNSGFHYNILKNLIINLRCNIAGERKNPSIIESIGNNIIEPAYVLTSVITYKDFYGFDFSLMVNNLFDTEYYHPSNRPPSRYRQPQRTILFKINYSLNLF